MRGCGEQCWSRARPQSSPAYAHRGSVVAKVLVRDVRGHNVIPRFYSPKERNVFGFGEPLQEEHPPVDVCPSRDACQQGLPHHRRRPLFEAVDLEGGNEPLASLDSSQLSIDALLYRAPAPESCKDL